jgi:biopolymer transport protein ExbD
MTRFLRRWGPCVVAVAACGRAPSTPNDPRLTACLGVHLRFLSALAEGKASEREPLACKGLYREAACGTAWATALRQADQLSKPGGPGAAKFPDLAAIVGACTKAYCTQLSPPVPAICAGPAPTDNPALVDALHALDVAVLKHDLRDPGAAEALGWKANVFRHVVVALEQPEAPASASPSRAFTVELRPGGAWVDGERVPLEALLVRASGARAEDPQIRGAIRADRRVPHRDVLSVLDILKQAGIVKVALAVAPEVPGRPSISTRGDVSSDE